MTGRGRGKKRTATSEESGGPESGKRKKSASAAKSWENAGGENEEQPQQLPERHQLLAQPDSVQSTAEATDESNNAVDTNEEEATVPNLLKHIDSLRKSSSTADDALHSMEWLKRDLCDRLPAFSTEPSEFHKFRKIHHQAVALGLYPALCACMSKYSENEMIQENGTCILFGLSATVARLEDVLAIIEIGFIEIVVSSLQKYPKNEEIVSRAMHFIANLPTEPFGTTWDDSEHMQVDAAFISNWSSMDNAVGTIFNTVYGQNMLHRKFRSVFTKVLHNLVVAAAKGIGGEGAQVRQQLMANGALSKVAQIIERFPNNKDLVKEARDALQILLPWNKSKQQESASFFLLQRGSKTHGALRLFYISIFKLILITILFDK